MPFDFDKIIDRRNSNSIKWKLFASDVLPMWVADMDFKVPEPVLKALREAVEHGVFGYDVIGEALTEGVAARMKKLYGWDVTPESIIPVTGLVSGFFAAAASLCRPGDGYVIQPPVYMPFNDIQKHLGVIRQEAPLTRNGDSKRLHYEIDWDVFEKAFNSGGSATRMFLLCNPHNPTGQVYSPAELTRMAEISIKNKSVIVSDEIHSELLLGGSKHTPIAMLSPEIADRSITLIAPSKTFNIAGLFCGFAIIPNPELRRDFFHAVERMTLHVSGMAQVAAMAAYSGECDGWLAELLPYLTANRDTLVDFVESNLPAVTVSVPDATYLAWLDFSQLVRDGKIKGSPYKFFLDEAHVALNDGATFGTGGENFVRMNFGCPRATLLDGLERMNNALNQ
jgi:cystathionine beta-lyase